MTFFIVFFLYSLKIICHVCVKIICAVFDVYNIFPTKSVLGKFMIFLRERERTLFVNHAV